MEPEEFLKNEISYYKQLETRFHEGDLKFIFGPSNWPEGSWNDPYCKVSIPLAVEIADLQPNIKLFNIYYHNQTDFQHIRFDLNQETYIIRWYKTFILCRKSDQKQIDFGFRSSNISQAIQHNSKRYQNLWQEKMLDTLWQTVN